MVLVHGVHRPSRARSAHDLVAHGIGQNIMQGHFPIGSTLPGDAELMELFGVSRTALREALKTLAAKGLIESKTKVGTKVLDRNNWNMFDADILDWHLRGRRRCSLPGMAFRDPADAGAARLRHSRCEAHAGAARHDASRASGDVRMRDQPAGLHQSRSDLPSGHPGGIRQSLPAVDRLGHRGGACRPPSPSALPSPATSASRRSCSSIRPCSTPSSSAIRLPQAMPCRT